jgi:hypothetical protein
VIITHITEGRVIGNHAEMGGSAPPSSSTPLNVSQVLGEVVDRRVGGKEMMAAQPTWDSGGGAAARDTADVKGESAPERSKGLLDAPHPAGPSSAL